MKGSGDRKLCYTEGHNSQTICHILSGLYFIPFVEKPWTLTFSKNKQMIYCCNLTTNKSYYKDDPKFAERLKHSSCGNSMLNRLLLRDERFNSSDSFQSLLAELHKWIEKIAPWLKNQ